MPCEWFDIDNDSSDEFLECEDFDRDAIIAQFLSTCSYASVAHALGSGASGGCGVAGARRCGVAGDVRGAGVAGDLRGAEQDAAAAGVAGDLRGAGKDAAAAGVAGDRAELD